MAAFNVWQKNVTDTSGNILSGAQITVKVQGGGNAEIFTDETGSTPKANPFLTGTDGLARFFVASGFYEITAFKSGVGSQTFVWENLGDAALRSELADGSANIAGKTAEFLSLGSAIVNPYQFGGESGESSNATQAFVDAYTYLESIGGGVIFIPPEVWMVDWDVLNIPSNISIFGVGEASVLKLTPTTFANVEAAVIKAVGEEANYKESICLNNFKIDFNLSAHTNAQDMIDANAGGLEAIDIKYVRNFLVNRVFIKDAISDGVDLDDCESGIVFGCSANGVGKSAFHCSFGSKNITIQNNEAFDCNKKIASRGAFSVTENAGTGIKLLGNRASDNRVNYFINRAGVVFDKANSSEQGINPDHLPFQVPFNAVLLRKSTQQIPNDTWTNLTWNQVVYDTDNAYDDNQNTRVTVPPGFKFARVSFCQSWEESSGGFRVSSLLKNGAAPVNANAWEWTQVQTENVPSDAIATVRRCTQTAVSSLIPVSAGDYFQVRARHNQGAELGYRGAESWVMIEFF